MDKGYHRVPSLDYEGKNLEEKESRHDLETKLSEIRDIRNNDFKGLEGNMLGSWKIWIH